MEPQCPDEGTVWHTTLNKKVHTQRPQLLLSLAHLSNGVVDFSPFGLLPGADVDSSLRPLKFFPFASPAIIMEQYNCEVFRELHKQCQKPNATVYVKKHSATLYFKNLT